MAIHLVSVSQNSLKAEVSFDVIGDAGHTPDCQGVLFGQGVVTAPPHSTPAQITVLVQAEASTIYAAGLAAWVLRQELTVLLPSPPPP